MKKHLILIALSVLAFACTPTKDRSMKNPFTENWATPFQVPPFDRIQPEHYLPAFEAGMEAHNLEIAAIANSQDAPDFYNTIEALEQSGDLLYKVSMVFFNVREAHTSEELDNIASTMAPLLSEHNDAIFLNEALFERVKQVYANRDALELEPAKARLLHLTYKRFVRSGANLADKEKEELRKINSRLALLELNFGQNMLAETNAYQLIIDNPGDLSGLPESVIAAAAEAAGEAKLEGKWVFTLHKPSWLPFLTYADNRELREQLYKAMYNRGNNNNEHDNKGVINEMVSLRLQKARLLGYDTWAAYVLDDNMAKTPKTVYDFLQQVWVPGLEWAKEEAADMQKIIERQGGQFKLESWDWWYYAEQIRREKYDLDEEQLRPYFELNNVRDGIFTVSQQLFGLTFELIPNMPQFHPEMEVFEVKDADGSHIGVLYMDYFPRPSKAGGAWMTSYREQYHENGSDVRPVISVTCNFSRPTGGKPALLSFDEVETLYHEFGHALHGLLSKTPYKTLSGTNVSRDFVELPSQIMEYWAAEPEVLRQYARHFETGEVIPAELLEKLANARKFNQGFITTEFVAAALLDMDFHTLTSTEAIDVNEFERQSMLTIGLIPEIIPRYKSTYFAHIFSGGYSSGYYSYLWAEVLDADAFEAFREAGNIFDEKVATAFRKEILEKGGSDEPMQLYLNFRGKEPNIAPLLRNRGLD